MKQRGANIEALWAARNIKYFPLIVAQMCKYENHDLKLNIKIGEEERSLNEMDLCNRDDVWSLLNLDPCEVHRLRQSLFDSWKKRKNNELKTDVEIQSDIKEKLKKVSRKEIDYLLGQNKIDPPVVIASLTRHYSIDKAVDILDVGKLIGVEIDKNFRMDVEALEACLDDCNNKKIPIIAVIGIMGSTEEGAIDPLHKILELRDYYKRRAIPLTFFVHADAAFGGYARSMFLGKVSSSSDPSILSVLPGIKARRFWDDFLPRVVVNNIINGKVQVEIDKEGLVLRLAKEHSNANIKTPLEEEVEDWPSERVHCEFESISRADTVTLDPHKLGFVPYPAGAVIFQRKFFRDFLQQDAPYIFSGAEESGCYVDKFIGRFILEGSKPGASASACWLAHRCIPLDLRGYGAIIGENIRGARSLYHHLKKCEDDLAIILPICEPDLNILCFIIGSRKADPPYTIEQLNELNENIHKRFSIDFEARKEKIIYTQPFWLSGSYSDEAYPPEITNRLLDALQLRQPSREEKNKKLKILRAVIMDPWFSSTSPGEKEIAEAFIECLLNVAHEEIDNLDKKIKGKSLDQSNSAPAAS